MTEKLLALKSLKSHQKKLYLFTKSMESKENCKMSASIRIMRSIVWNEGFETMKDNPFIKIMTSREYAKFYADILKAETNESSLKLKFELAWFLINITSLKIFTKDHLAVMMEEGVVEHLINMLNFDYEENDTPKMFVWYYWVWVIKHFFLTVDYDHKLLIELGIISKIVSIFTNWRYLFSKEVDKPFNRFIDRFFELLYLIVKKADKDYFVQIYEIVKIFGKIFLWR